eukprot:723295-Pleurochrysis_carterae.AAC.2
MFAQTQRCRVCAHLVRPMPLLFPQETAGGPQSLLQSAVELAATDWAALMLERAGGPTAT